MTYVQSDSRIETDYDDSLANQSISLGKRNFVLTFPNGTAIANELALTFILSTSLRTEAIFTTDFNSQADGNFYFASTKQSFKLAIDELEPQKWILSNYNISTSGAKSVTCRVVFRPKTDRLVTTPRSDIVYAKFHLINHINFLGERIVKNQRSFIDRLVLQSSEWRITIDSTEVTKANIEALEDVGGYALTHVGLVERLDGQVFTSAELQQILNDLGLFLRFVNGWALSPTLVEGYDQSDTIIWNLYAAPPTSEWRPHRQQPHNWFNRFDAKLVLPVLYSEFDKLIRVPEWREALQRAVYWYIQGNLRNSGVDSSLILVHSTLELLAWMYLVVDPTTKTISKTKFKDSKGYNWTAKILDLLIACGISATVPVKLSELQKFHVTSGASNAPDCLNKLRNDLVHPEKQNAITSGALMHEALYLALNYIELP